MKHFFSAIWNSPASTFAGAICALGLWLASAELDLPKEFAIPAAGVVVFVGAAYSHKPDGE